MTIRERLKEGNRRFIETADAARRMDTALNGQHPYAIVVCCSDSRVIPEQIFHAGIGDLFVIRVAGNVLDNHQLGSIEYAAGHLHCGHIIVLGHTGCGAVRAAMTGGGEGLNCFIVGNAFLVSSTASENNASTSLSAAHWKRNPRISMGIDLTTEMTTQCSPCVFMCASIATYGMRKSPAIVGFP